MGKLLSRKTIRERLLFAALLLLTAALLRWPGETAQAARTGLLLCGNVILPSLFPFFVLSTLAVELGLTRSLGRLFEGLMQPLFRVGGAGASALLLGFVGGYPVGARTAIALYQSGQCSKAETQRLLAFCNNAGPAFILGAVGSGIFGGGAAGALLFGTHLAASLLVGLIFRFSGGTEWGSGERLPARSVRFAPALVSAIQEGAASALNICGFVVFFAVLIEVLALSGLFPAAARLLAALFSPWGLTEAWARRLLAGLLELSTGVSALSGPGALGGRLPMAAFMLGWAGLSVHCQVLAFLGESGLSMRGYFLGKLLHGALSAALTAAVLRLLPQALQASALLGEQAESVAALDFKHALAVSCLCALGLWLCFFFSALRPTRNAKRPVFSFPERENESSQKNSGNAGKKAL